MHLTAHKILNNKSMMIAVIGSLLFWLASSIYDYSLFYDEFMRSLLSPHISDLVYRLTIVVVIFSAAAIIGYYINEVKTLKIELSSEKRKREDVESVLEASTFIDADTGLFSQVATMKFIEHEVNQFKRFKTDLSVVFVNVEGLKEYYSKQPKHQADELRNELTEIFLNTLRRSDMVGRWGKDNYVLATVKTSYEQAVLVESKVYKKIDYLIKKHDPLLEVKTNVAQLLETDTTMDFLNKISSFQRAA